MRLFLLIILYITTTSAFSQDTLVVDKKEGSASQKAKKNIKKRDTAFVQKAKNKAIPKIKKLVGDSWKNTFKNGQGTIIMTYIETPNFIFKNKNNKLDGICVDILKEFVIYVQRKKAVRINIVIEKKDNNFTKFLDKVKNGRGGVLGIGPITITNERKRVMYFTPSFTDNLSVLLTHNSAPELKKINEISKIFKGMKAYALKNSTQERELIELKKKYYPNLKIKYVLSPEGLMNAIKKDPKSFTKIDFLFYVDATQRKSPIKRHPVADIRTRPLGFIMPYGSDWAPVWNEFMNGVDGFRNSTEYKKILVKHLGSNLAKVLINLR